MTRRGAFELVEVGRGRSRLGGRWVQLARWRCACGVVTLRNAKAPGRDCGCGAWMKSAKAQPSSTPGATVLRDLWRQMIRRCADTSDPRYGGRGITVCERWRTSFDAFVDDLGPREAEGISLDRIDNDRGYWCGDSRCWDCGPEDRSRNVRWATATEQGRNRSTNRMVTAFGVAHCLSVWSEMTGVPSGTIAARLDRGWKSEGAVSWPTGGV